LSFAFLSPIADMYTTLSFFMFQTFAELWLYLFCSNTVQKSPSGYTFLQRFLKSVPITWEPKGLSVAGDTTV
jgi:hypothetical protein